MDEITDDQTNIYTMRTLKFEQTDWWVRRDRRHYTILHPLLNPLPEHYV
jgi:hypothetical protein